MARPGSSMRLNFPMRSTIHAVCCGTNRITVFVGRRLPDEKYEGSPGLELPREEKTFVGSVAACELSCEKLRTEDVVKAAASGDVLEIASDLELRSSPEAVLAASRVRDAIIVSFGASDDDVEHAKLQAAVGECLYPPPTAALCNLSITSP